MGTLKKQTAVEWFAQWLNDNPVVYQKNYYAAIEWAKAIEKEQIVDAWCNGFDKHKQKTLTFALNPPTSSPLNFYNETYGGNE